MSKRSPPRLTPRQEQFVDEYLIDLNATQAAIRAGYSRKTADRIGPELLGKTCVSDAIQRRRRDRERRTEITQDRVLQELAAIAFARGTDYASVSPGGVVHIKPTDELNDTQKAAVLSIKETQNGVEIKLADKVRALELLGKHQGLFDGSGREDKAPINNLLEQIQRSTRALEEDGDAIREIQPETADQHELVADEAIPES